MDRPKQYRWFDVPDETIFVSAYEDVRKYCDEVEAEIAGLRTQKEASLNLDMSRVQRFAALEAELAEANHWLQSREAELKTAQDTLVDVYAELAAKQIELEAWFSIFGTQQLSHASARLEAAESKVRRLEAQLAEREKRIEEFEVWHREYVDSIKTALAPEAAVNNVEDRVRDKEEIRALSRPRRKWS